MRVQQNFIGEHGETDIHFQRGATVARRQIRAANP
jgi:hypothetical protein